MEDDISASKILSDHKFPKINAGLLTSPSYTTNNSLESKLLHGDDSTYDYILDLRERDLTKTAMQKIQANCEKHKIELQKINKYLNEKPFAGASLWLQEIDSFLKALK